MYLILIVICTRAALSDIRTGKIYNKHLLWGVCSGAPACLIYYGVYCREMIVPFLINFCGALLIAVFFYKLKIWGAGDSKLWLTVCLLLPWGGYLLRDYSLFPLLDVLMIVFVLAYVYALVETGSEWMRGRRTEFHHGGFIQSIGTVESVMNFIFSFFSLRLFYRFCILFFHQYYRGNYLFFVMAGFLGMLQILKKPIRSSLKKAIIGIGIALFLYDGIHSLWLEKAGHESVEVISLAVAGVVILLRFGLEQYNYIIIPTESVRAGMVLSGATVMKFRSSRVQGLPASIEETARCRLTEEEAASVRRWRTSKFGEETVTVVKYFPFAIFIAVGLLIYQIGAWWLYG